MSLRLRLTLLNSLIVLLVGGTLVAAVYAILARGLERQIDTSLREQARLYGADVSLGALRDARRSAGPSGQPRPPGATDGPRSPGDPGRAGRAEGGRPEGGRPEGGRPEGGRPPGGPDGPPDSAAWLGPPSLVVPILRRFAGTSTFVQVVDSAGQIQAHSENLGDDTLPLPPEALSRALAGQEWLGEVTVEGQRLRQLVTPLRVTPPPGEPAPQPTAPQASAPQASAPQASAPQASAPQASDPRTPPPPLVLQVAQPLGALDETLRTLQTTVLVVGIAGALVAVVAGWLLARTALHPIDRLAAAATAIGAARDFGRRVPVAGGRPDEIGRLAMSFNAMLGELQAAHEQVSTALDAQRRFVADASHELRTPLATMRGNIDLLRQMLADLGADDIQQAAILDDVSAEAERMSRLLADLLLLAQADAGQHLTLRPLDVGPLALDAARSARLLRDGVTLDASGVADGLWVRGHADRLRQVVLALLDNALKHSLPGGQVTLIARREPAHAGGAVGAGAPGSDRAARPRGRSATETGRPGSDGGAARTASANGSGGGADGWVLLQVADDGPGIPPAEQARIFDRFYRAAGSRSGEGTGLGLAIARWIVEEHHGTILVSSVPGVGATFTVRLPALTAPPDPAAGADAPDAGRAAPVPTAR